MVLRLMAAGRVTWGVGMSVAHSCRVVIGHRGFSCRGALITPPEATNTGPDLTGGPKAAPEGAVSKNGWGHMRVQRGGVSSSPRPLSVCVSLLSH